jgi:hypothetical protein
MIHQFSISFGSPLLQPLDGQKLVKVSGTVGDVDSEWRVLPRSVKDYKNLRCISAFCDDENTG